MTEPKSEAVQLPPELLQSIEEFRKRKKYSSFDLQTLQEIKDHHIEQALLDYVFDKVNKARDRRSAILSLSRGFQVLYMTWLVEAEVLNGGFNQYFWNSSGRFADLTPATLREIGADEAASIMEKALQIATAEIPQMAKFRAANTPEAFSESYKHTRLNELDGPFSKLAEGFPGLRLRYIRANESRFVTK